MQKKYLSLILSMMPLLGIAGHMDKKIAHEVLPVSINIMPGGKKTIIAGTITSKGVLVFVNSKGFVFEKTAKIIAPGVIFSTLPISKDLNNGTMVFEGNAKNQKIINKGIIETPDDGFSAFLGSKFVNQGVLKTGSMENIEKTRIQCTGVGSTFLSCK